MAVLPVSPLFSLSPVQAVVDVQGPAPLKVLHLGLQLQNLGLQPPSVLQSLPGLASLNRGLNIMSDVWPELTRSRQCSSEDRAEGRG